MDTPAHERSDTINSTVPPAHKKQRREGLYGVWGVLVARNPPSRKNGLLAHLQCCRCAVAGADVPWKGSVKKSASPSSMRSAGEHWLRRRVPPALRQVYFPAGSHSGSKRPCAAASAESPENSRAGSSEPGGDKSHTPSTRLLLPLCSTRSNNGAVSLGRLASNDIVFATNPCVSSVHCTIACQWGSDRLRGGAASETAVAEQLQQCPSGKAHIVLSDYSTNGCLVNGRHVGKGRQVSLRDGDAVELINAGPRHTTDYNVAFVFLSADAFVRWVAEQAAQLKTMRGNDEDTAVMEKAAEGEGQQREALQAAARRRALLCRAQWNIEAQVRRMYGHSVDEYYSLDRAHPLGKGTFGTVYRASLRADAPASSSSVFFPHTGDSVSAGVHTGWEYAFSSAGAGAWMANPSEAAQLRDAYIRWREQVAPARVRRASASAASSTAVKAEGSTVDAAPQVFAVKVIRKQRMLVEALGQLQQQQQPKANGVQVVVYRCLAVAMPPPPPPPELRRRWKSQCRP
ncbi:hypothetical protein LSCM1_07456 [Leishmania martiniquensis]|uniref:FHA domain-containing protein n=1 Tax=Leishmania martiniquensis TaxID=1580590 RepID=A0A836H635_9TRYP|nr:hypothetical protein LSCM1_07456 [Leishmania martiniquensis]